MHVVQELSPLLIRSRQGDYPVEFRATIGELVERLLEVPEAVVVCDSNIAELYARELAPLFADRPTRLVEANEEAKSLAGVGELVQ